MADGSVTDDPGMDASPPPGPDPDAAGQGAAGGPPQRRGPILAALSRRQTGPQVSAPGPGDQASSITMVTNALALLQQALPGLMPGSPVHRDALRALNSLSRHVGQGGGTTAGVQQTQLHDLLRNTVRNALLQKIMGQQAGGPQGGGPAPPMPGGAPAQAPMPSTPLPGA